MNCVSSGITCTFAADRLAILERSVTNYARMRSAALESSRSGKIEARFIAEDVAVLDSKMKEYQARMTLLKPCVRA
jgi:hypothetical protein